MTAVGTCGRITVGEVVLVEYGAIQIVIAILLFKWHLLDVGRNH